MQQTRTALTRNVRNHTANMIWWTDLQSKGIAQSTEFYANVFGWTFDSMMDDANGAYGFFRIGELGIAGCGTSAEFLASPMSASWTSYVLVDDIKTTAARAVELGATIIVEPMEVFDSGWFAVLADPTGAQVSLWQAGTHKGADAVSQPGAWTWSELYSSDVEKTTSFYTTLFGWSAKAGTMGMDGYTVFWNGEEMVGGMMAKPEMMEKAGAPDMWLSYFAVADTDATISAVTASGGSVVVPAMDISIGRFAIVADPQGATFGVITATEPNQG